MQSLEFNPHEESTVSITPVPDAAGCGSNHCRSADNLHRVYGDGIERKTLCPSHVADYIIRELLGE